MKKILMESVFLFLLLLILSLFVLWSCVSFKPFICTTGSSFAMYTRFSSDRLFQINIYHLIYVCWQYCGLPSFSWHWSAIKWPKKKHTRKVISINIRWISKTLDLFPAAAYPLCHCHRTSPHTFLSIDQKIAYYMLEKRNKQRET